MHINLESSIYIKSHPLLSEKDDIKEKYLTIFSYFIGNYTDDSDWSNELINLYHKYFDVNLNLSSNLNIIKQNVNELCTWKYQNKRAAYYKILLVQDLLYYFDIQESSKTEKAMNELGDIFEDFFKEDYQIILNAALKNNLVISEIENYWKKVIINLQKTHKKNALNYVIKLIILAGLVWWPFIGLFVAAIYSFIVKEKYLFVCKKGLINLYIFFKYAILNIKEYISLNEVKSENVCIFSHYKYQNSMFLNKKQFKILVTATMSAGKSSLLNALIGSNVNNVASEATTNNIKYIYNKSFEDNLIYRIGENLNFDYNLEKNDTFSNSKDEIYLKFKSDVLKQERILYIDTPGINFSGDDSHAKITKEELEKREYDLILYVFNMQHLRTFDDEKHLKYLKNFVNSNEIIFVINKIDECNVEDDSLIDVINNTKIFLCNLGYTDPCIIPLSSKAANLYKRNKYYDNLNEFEKIQLLIFEKQFEAENMNVNKLFEKENLLNCELLMNSGFNMLENEIKRRIIK